MLQEGNKQLTYAPKVNQNQAEQATNANFYRFHKHQIKTWTTSTRSTPISSYFFIMYSTGELARET